MIRKSSKLGAGVAAAMLVAALGAGAYTPAFGAPGAQTTVSGASQEHTANVALVNGAADVQLTIHKFYGAAGTEPNNGTIQNISKPPLEGVPFDIYKVEGVSLTTNDGWKTAAELYKTNITVANNVPSITGKTLTKVATVTSGADGTATFTKANGVGVYVVVENLSGVTTVKKHENGATEDIDVAKVTPAKPFLVTLPMTEPVNKQTWMYDVHVYPKNQSDTITKEVKDEGTVTFGGNANPTKLGGAAKHEVTYTITSSITDGSEPLGKYVIYDEIDPRVDIQSIDLKLSDDTALACGTDYDIKIAGNAVACDGIANADPKNGKVEIAFKDTDAATDGVQLGKLEGNRDKDVVTTIKVQVNDEGAKGIIENTASFIPNKPWEESNPGKTIPSNPVESRYGDLNLEKVDAKNNATKLDGAVFSIYKAGKDGKCDDADVNASAKPLYTGVTTAGGGKATVKGLQASDWYDGKAQTEKQGYCLVETKAPEGYNLLAQPIHFYVTANKKVVTAADGTTTETAIEEATQEPASLTYTVNNEKSNLDNELPKTGGAGTLALALAGLACIGGGIGWYLSASRKTVKN